MILTNKQEQGLKIAIDRYKNNERFTVISGYAGTGKSTLVKYLIAALNVREDDVCYAAFTGKAASCAFFLAIAFFFFLRFAPQTIKTIRRIITASAAPPMIMAC